MYDYGREIYNELQTIYELLSDFYQSFQSWQASFQTFLQGLYNNIFPLLFLSVCLLGCFFVFRLFFPDWRS